MKFLPDNKTKYKLSKQQLAKENERALKVLGGITLLGGGITGLGYKVAKKGLSRFQKLSKVEQKQAVRKGVGVPEREFTLYRGVPQKTKNTLSNAKERLKMKNTTFGRWATTSKTDAAITYGGAKGKLFKGKFNQKEMLKIAKGSHKDDFGGVPYLSTKPMNVFGKPSYTDLLKQKPPGAFYGVVPRSLIKNFKEVPLRTNRYKGNKANPLSFERLRNKKTTLKIQDIIKSMNL
jgi:hypothetical protein